MSERGHSTVGLSSAMRNVVYPHPPLPAISFPLPTFYPRKMQKQSGKEHTPPLDFRPCVSSRLPQPYLSLLLLSVIFALHAHCPCPHVIAPFPFLYDECSELSTPDAACIDALGIFGKLKATAGVVAIDDGLALGTRE